MDTFRNYWQQQVTKSSKLQTVLIHPVTSQSYGARSSRTNGAKMAITASYGHRSSHLRRRGMGPPPMGLLRDVLAILAQDRIQRQRPLPVPSPALPSSAFPIPFPYTKCAHRWQQQVLLALGPGTCPTLGTSGNGAWCWQ